MKLTMFAWGNPSRGDDAVGPWFADRFRAREGENFALVEDFQLQVEHLLDCRESQLLLFVDACSSGGGDYRFEEVAAGPLVSHTSHYLAPQELLAYYQQVFKETPPPAFLLAVPGHSFDLGEEMSPATLTCCELAAGFVEQLLHSPGDSQWREFVDANGAESGRA